MFDHNTLKSDFYSFLKIIEQSIVFIVCKSFMKLYDLDKLFNIEIPFI